MFRFPHSISVAMLAALALSGACSSDGGGDRGGDGRGKVRGLKAGWELAPRASYSASQSVGAVTLRAQGENPLTNFETKLFQSPRRIFPPQYLLAHRRTGEAGGGAMTPFDVTATFPASDVVAAVIVRDASGDARVPVDQARGRVNSQR